MEKKDIKENPPGRVARFPLKLFYSLVGKLFQQDDRIAFRLSNYFPTYRSAFGETMNQLYRVLKRPFSYDIQGIVIEPTNFCNLRCRHCTAQIIPDIKKGFMDFELFEGIIDSNPQLRCLILTRNGEPLMHPRIFDMIRYARDKKIYVNLYTNGMLLSDERIGKVFESGLSELNFSMEGVGDYYKYNRGKDYSLIESAVNRLVLEKKRKGSPLVIGINSTVPEDSAHGEEVKKTWGDIVDHVTIVPLMGDRSEPRRKPCRTLWRNLVVTWDGNVVPCCIDMKNTLFLGNIRDNSLKEIFNGLEAKRIRTGHVKGEYPPVCKNCDYYFG